jgi:hypothetical protein
MKKTEFTHGNDLEVSTILVSTSGVFQKRSEDMPKYQ